MLARGCRALEILRLSRDQLFLVGLEALAADEDLVDLDLDEALAMTLQFLVLLLALEVEDDELVATAFRDDFADDLGAVELGLEAALAAGEGNDVRELDGAVFVGGLLDAERVAGSHAVLLSTGLDNCVHRNLKGAERGLALATRFLQDVVSGGGR